VAGKPGTTAALYVADAGHVVRFVPDRARPIVLYCNGPYCGRSKRLAAELAKIGYTQVRRYQLGIPTWRALGGVTQVERAALVDLLARDQTAVLVDARPPAAAQPRLPRARPPRPVVYHLSPRCFSCSFTPGWPCSSPARPWHRFIRRTRRPSTAASMIQPG